VLGKTRRWQNTFKVARREMEGVIIELTPDCV